jgi:hypothetical protein
VVARATVVPSFWIDSRGATPSEYAACVTAGICPESTQPQYWKDQLNEASVTRDGAARFCKWRGGSLPTFAQWQLAAVPGPLGLDLSCARPVRSFVEHDCQQTARSGMTFRTRSSNHGEWLLDEDCIDGAQQIVALSLAGDSVGRVTRLLDHFAVRCAFSTQPPAAGADTPPHESNP